MGREKVFIWGAGGHGRVLLDVFRRGKEFEVVYFLDDNPKIKGKMIGGVEVLGGEEVLKGLKEKGIRKGIAGVGDCDKRCQMFETLKKQGFSLVNAIDPTALIVPSAKIGEGVTIWAGSVVNVNAQVGDNVIVNEGASISHDDIVGYAAHIAAGVRMMGGVEIGERTVIGVGAVVICKKIGRNSLIGAGSVVHQDVPDNVVAVGFPARVVGKRE